MLKTAFNSVALALGLFVAASTATAQDIRPVPDPTFSPELASRCKIRGSELMQVVEQTQSRSRIGHVFGMNYYFALTQQWKLEYSVLRDGSVGSARAVDAAAARPGARVIPKPIALLGLAISTAGDSGIDDFDSGDEGEATALPSDDELDLVCGDDWIVTWLEDEHGNPIAGTTELYCGGTTIPLD